MDLPLPVRPSKPNTVPGFRREGEMLQNVRLGVVFIVKRDVLKRHGQRAGRESHARPIVDGRLDLAQLGNAIDAGARSLQVLHLAQNLPQRAFQQVDVVENQVELADGHASARRRR